MLDWTRRRSPAGEISFLACSSRNVHLLVAPGTPLPGWDERNDHGDGLWQHARWSRRTEEPLVDLERPTAVRRVRTVHVVSMVGPGLADDVVAAVDAQLRQARLLVEPAPGCLVSDRSVRAVGGLLMALNSEAREAFPTDTFWRLSDPGGTADAADDFAEFLDRVPAPLSARRNERELRTVVLLELLAMAVIRHLRRRPRPTTRDLGRLWEKRGTSEGVPGPECADQQPMMAGLVPPPL